MSQHHVFGKRSAEALATCSPPLRGLCVEALAAAPFDLTVTCGRRSKEDQEKAVAEGRSKVHWPHGKHNTADPGALSRAVDIHPYPVDFEDTRRYYILAGVMLAIARRRGIAIRWGGDWDGDGTLTDQSFNDLPHFELRQST